MRIAVFIFGSVAPLYAAFWCGVYLGERGKLRAWWPGRKPR